MLGRMITLRISKVFFNASAPNCSSVKDGCTGFPTGSVQFVFT